MIARSGRPRWLLRALIVAAMGSPVGRAEEPGALIWVGAPGADVGGLSLASPSALLLRLGLRPRPAPVDPSVFLGHVAKAEEFYQRDSKLNRCVEELVRALVVVPSTVIPARTAEVAQALAFAAQVFLADKRQAQAETAVAALLTISPFGSMDADRTPPEVIALVESKRSASRTSARFAWQEPVPSDCGLVFGSERRPAGSAPPDGWVTLYVECAGQASKFVHEARARVTVSAWEVGLVVSSGAFAVATEADGRSLAEALLGIEGSPKPGWAAVLVPKGERVAVWLHEDGGGRRLEASTSGVWEAIAAAIADPNPSLVAEVAGEPNARVRPWWHWTLIGVGAAGVAGGGAAHGLALANREERNTGAPVDVDEDAQFAAGVSLYAIGGVALVTGIIFAALGEAPDEPGAPDATSP